MFYNTQGELTIKENYNNNFIDYKNLLFVVMSCKKNSHLWHNILSKYKKNLNIFYANPNLKIVYT